MNPAALFFRTFLLSAFTLSLLVSAIVADYYGRHEVTRKAKRFLAERGVELSPSSSIEAARKGELLLLEQLEVAGISLGSGDDRGLTPLLAAVKAGNHPSIEFLMAREAVADSINRVSEPERETPLAVALRERDFALVDKLLEMGASLEVDLEPGVPFLMAAVRSGDAESIDYLLRKGVEVDYRSAQATTALALAAEKGEAPLMKRLIEAGADPNTRGAPTGFTIPVREVRLSAGAGFIVAICGEIMTMPGLPKVPSAEVIRLNDQGFVEGLF